MKSLTRFCETGASSSMTSFKSNGGRRLPRHSFPRTNVATGENAEMEIYLSKLKKLVPFMPRNRKVSKLEIIQHVIDYICDLQTELQTHPEINNYKESATLNFTSNQMQNDNDNCDYEDCNKNEQEDDEDEDDEEEEDMIQSNRLTVNVNGHQEQIMETNSSLIVGTQQRQPLVDRQVPNTILPSVSGQAAITTTTTTTHNHYDIKHW